MFQVLVHMVSEAVVEQIRLDTDNPAREPQHRFLASFAEHEARVVTWKPKLIFRQELGGGHWNFVDHEITKFLPGRYCIVLGSNDAYTERTIVSLFSHSWVATE
jgi:hypothetical protein